MISPKPDTALEFTLSKNNSEKSEGYAKALHDFLGGMFIYSVLQVAYLKLNN